MNKILREQIKNNILAISLGVILLFIYETILVKGIDLIGVQIDILLNAGEIVDYSFIWKLIQMAMWGFLASFFSSMLIGKSAILSVSHIRSKVVMIIPDLPYKYLSINGTGEIVNKLISDIDKVRILLEQTFPNLIMYGATILVICFYIVKRDVNLLITIIFFYPIMLFVSKSIAEKLKILAQKRAFKNDRLTDIAIDSIHGIECVKANNIDNIMYMKMQRIIDDILKNEYERTRVSSLSWVLQMFIKWVPMIICIIQILFETMNGKLSVGNSFTTIILLNKMVHPMSSIPFLFNDYKETLVSIERIEELMNLEKERGGNKVLPLKCENNEILQLYNVDFKYNNEKNVLNKISFNIKNGEKVAFVGPSGSGKSTIFKLFIRYYDPENGMYQIYGNNSKDITIDSLRSKFAVVSQNTFLFSGTIYENIAIGNFDVSKDDVIKCCKRVGLNDFIEKLDKGYDTIVGEKGCMISGGQRQRISIARAMLKDAPIILLDEPTSSIDEENERKIKLMVEELLSNRTIIYIAHRLSTIKDVDQIFVIENGEIVQRGSHNELMRQDGIYKSLYKRESENV